MKVPRFCKYVMNNNPQSEAELRYVVVRIERERVCLLIERVPESQTDSTTQLSWRRREVLSKDPLQRFPFWKEKAYLLVMLDRFFLDKLATVEASSPMVASFEYTWQCHR